MAQRRRLGLGGALVGGLLAVVACDPSSETPGPTTGGQPTSGAGGGGAPSGGTRTGGVGPGTGGRPSSGGLPASDAGEPLRVAIPLYIWPGEGTEWGQVAAAGTAISYIIANAGDPGGPGPTADSAYTTAITLAHQAGQRVVGYVDTDYANRDLGAVESEVDEWYVFYPSIDGIFFDLTPSSADRIRDYYQPASDHVRSKPGPHVVIINPGQPQFDEGYMAVADIAMSYENPYGSATDGYARGEYSAPSWVTKYAAGRFWHVILEVSDQGAMQNVLDLARTRNVGHVYVTNYPDPPAYARLPTYFADEVRAVAP